MEVYSFITQRTESWERERDVNGKIAKKPDGYYYFEGITFILDAKAEGKPFIGQLEDYMKLEKNPNFIGFKYNGVDFECYVRGVLQKNETELKDRDYYKNNCSLYSSFVKILILLFGISKPKLSQPS